MKAAKYIPLLWRILSGLFGAIVGIVLVRQYLSDLALFGQIRFERIVAALAFGAFGFFLVPMLTEIIRTWSVILASRVATEVVRQMHALSRSRTARKEKQWVNPLVLDTSAIIDGRLLDIANTGFLVGTLIVPKSILTELHTIADSSDTIRRKRGRRGLDVLSALKKVKHVQVVITADILDGDTVDQKVIALAKAVRGRIITTDFNLNKVAQVQGVAVLNVNQLANAVKTPVIPGEQITIKVIALGKSPEQGIGYLEDGTMIVVENGARLIGQEITADVARVIQTMAGRMLFVKAPK